MNIKQLTPNYIKQFSKTLQNAGVKSSVLEIFFDAVTELIDPYEHGVTQNVQDILKECKFDSMDDINAFLYEYNDFTNSSIEFINLFTVADDTDAFEKKVRLLVEALYTQSQKRDSYQILLQKIDTILAKTIEVYEIDVVSLADSDDYVGYLTDIFEIEETAFHMAMLMSASMSMHEKEIDKDDFEALVANFILSATFVSVLNEFRKVELESIEENKKFVPRSIKEEVIKVGRNDLCPCGSGKKYKKCCMNKKDEKKVNPLDELDLPMATHFPLSDSDINNFYAIWTRLIDFTNRLYCNMHGKKYKKFQSRDKNGKYSFNSEIMEDNYYLHLREFLLTNFNRIIDNFIDSTRVSKANQEVLQEWKRYRLMNDNFFIYEKVPYGALVWDATESKYYYVYDLYDSLYEISLKETPLSMLLLPFKGRVICDGVIGHVNIDFGQNSKDMFLSEYVALRKNKSFSTSLPSHSSTTKIYQLKIGIKGAKPPIWRRVLVEDDMTYKSMHMIIQDIYDWYGGHLHEFITANRNYTDLEFGNDFGEDENKFTIGEDLREIGDKIAYVYDFGDDWEHEIKLEDILESDEDAYYPKCVKGKGRGPLEDIGGIWAYNTIVEAYKKGNKETLDEFYVDEDFDPMEFDLAKVNVILGA